MSISLSCALVLCPFFFRLLCLLLCVCVVCPLACIAHCSGLERVNKIKGFKTEGIVL